MAFVCRTHSAEIVQEREEDELQRLRERLEAEPQNADHHIEIVCLSFYFFPLLYQTFSSNSERGNALQGLFLWNKGQKDNSKEMKEKAAESFVVSARLNPNNGVAFRYLGHYYSQVSVDLQRASKCYLRAVNLCPEDFESGVSALTVNSFFVAAPVTSSATFNAGKSM